MQLKNNHLLVISGMMILALTVSCNDSISPDMSNDINQEENTVEAKSEYTAGEKTIDLENEEESDTQNENISYPESNNYSEIPDTSSDSYGQDKHDKSSELNKPSVFPEDKSSSSSGHFKPVSDSPNEVHSQKPEVNITPEPWINNVYFRNQENNRNISVYDIGRRLDGINGGYNEIFLKNSGENEVPFTLEIRGKNSDLFEVQINENILIPESIIPVIVRYKGETDPGYLSDKSCDIVIISDNLEKTLTVNATPVVDDSWALHTLIAPGYSQNKLLELYEIFQSRNYPEANLAKGILKVHIFALGDGQDNLENAQSAYEYLNKIPEENNLGNDELVIVYKGVAQAFIAQKRAVTGASNLDLMQEYLERISDTSQRWYPQYWKGVTYLRTSQGIRDTFGRGFNTFINPFRHQIINIWEPEGAKALTKVRDIYNESNIPLGSMDGFKYNVKNLPVPEEIREDSSQTGSNAFVWN